MALLCRIPAADYRCEAGNDVHSASAVDCMEKHLSFVHKSFNDSMTPLKMTHLEQQVERGKKGKKKNLLGCEGSVAFSGRQRASWVAVTMSSYPFSWSPRCWCVAPR